MKSAFEPIRPEDEIVANRAYFSMIILTYAYGPECITNRKMEESD